MVTLYGKDHYLGKWNTTASKAEYNRLIGEWLLPAVTFLPPWRLRSDGGRVGGCLLAPTPRATIGSRPAHAGRWIGSGWPSGCCGPPTATRWPHDFGPLALQAIQRQLADRPCCRSIATV